MSVPRRYAFLLCVLVAAVGCYILAAAGPHVRGGDVETTRQLPGLCFIAVSLVLAWWLARKA